MKRQLPIEIRPMRGFDMAAVMEIERHSFSMPWTEPEMRNCIRMHGIAALVATYNDTVVGFMVMEVDKREIVLLNLAVHEDWRYKRVGAQLIDYAKSMLNNKIETIGLGTFAENLDAQLFFRQMGFKCIGTDRYEYQNSEWEVYVFEFSRPAEVAEACDDEKGRPHRKAKGDR